ncbi:MAG: hypothetical protein Q4B09_09305, partial [Lachnospiraceae bacterium]|nr:hypothetical protein [Lachnospiraceae bacterium]
MDQNDHGVSGGVPGETRNDIPNKAPEDAFADSREETSRAAAPKNPNPAPASGGAGGQPPRNDLQASVRNSMRTAIAAICISVVGMVGMTAFMNSRISGMNTRMNELETKTDEVAAQAEALGLAEAETMEKAEAAGSLASALQERMDEQEAQAAAEAEALLAAKRAYISEVEAASTKMIAGVSEAKECGSSIYNVLFNAKYEIRSEATDAYTYHSKSGAFRDESAAAALLFEDTAFAEKITNLKTNKEEAGELLAAVSAAPEGLDAVSDSLQDFRTSYTKLTDLVVNSENALDSDSFPEKFNTTVAETITRFESLKANLAKAKAKLPEEESEDVLSAAEPAETESIESEAAEAVAESAAESAAEAVESEVEANRAIVEAEPVETASSEEAAAEPAAESTVESESVSAAESAAEAVKAESAEDVAVVEAESFPEAVESEIESAAAAVDVESVLEAVESEVESAAAAVDVE